MNILFLLTFVAVGLFFSFINTASATQQLITGTLGATSSIVRLDGQTITTTINETSGALGTALNPGFTVVTNNSATLSFAAQVETSNSGNVNALSNISGTYYLAMANTDHLPLAASVTDALQTTPTADGSPNVISYALTGVPSNGTGMGAFTWSTDHFESTIATGCSSNTIMTTTTAARGNTFSLTNDQAGSYQTTIIATFI